jgi:hypothetical protein
MSLRIEYFRDSLKVGAVPCPTNPDDALKLAEAGLIRHGADSAILRDMDHQGKVISTLRR